MTEYQIADLYRLVCNAVGEQIKQLHIHQCDESGSRNPDRYDDKGIELKKAIDVLKEVRDKLETLL